MQLSLLSRTVPSSSDARTGPSTLPGAWRDSAISQLDTLAAANERVALQSLPGRVFAAAGLLVAVVLAAAVLWPAPGQSAAVRVSAARPPVAPLPVVASAMQATLLTAADTAHGGAAVMADAPAPAQSSDDAALSSVGSDDEEARKARAVRRKAALLAQERERADEDARRQMQALAVQREEAERTRQEEARQAQAESARERAAAEQTRRQVSTAAAAAIPARRGVAEQCAGSGGLASEQACHARSCWRPEHRADPACVQLQDAEAQRALRGSER